MLVSLTRPTLNFPGWPGTGETQRRAHSEIDARIDLFNFKIWLFRLLFPMMLV